MNRFLAAVRNLLGSRRADRDTDAELRAYLDLSIGELERQGRSPDEARRAARVDLGSALAVVDDVRDARAGQRLEMLWRDLRYAVRTLRRAPAYTIAVVGVLALGIGSDTAVFSLVRGVLLNPIPLPDGAALVRVLHTPPPASFPGIKVFAVSPANYLDWKAQNRVFEETAVYQTFRRTLTGGDQAESVPVAAVEPSLFTVVRMRPAIGRPFDPSEAVPGHDQVALVSMGFWQQHFGDTPLSGQTVTLDNRRYAVIGVMPARFTWPAWAMTSASIWVPLAWDATERAVRDNHNYQVIARLRAGMTIADAHAEMDDISKRLARDYPKEDTGWGAMVLGLRDLVVGDVRQPLLILLGAVAFVLLIAVANAANLMLGRALGRQRELAIRFAIGGSQRRVIEQLLIEAFVVAVATAAIGWALAKGALAVFGTSLADQLPRAAEVAMDWRMFAFALAVSVATGVLAAIGPAVAASRAGLQATLRRGMGQGVLSGTGQVSRRLLVAAEVALSLVLLVGAGLMIRSTAALARVDPGFDPGHLVTVTVGLPRAKYTSPAQASQFFDRTLEGIRALPGVTSAAFVDAVPLTGGAIQPFSIVGRPPPRAADEFEIGTRTASPGYLKTLGIPLVRGRDLDPHDAHAVLVSATAARAFWPDQDPLGQRLIFTFTPGVTWDVVGIVGDVKLEGLDSTASAAAAYQWQSERPWTFEVFVARTTGPPARMAAPILGVIHGIDPDLAARDVSTMEETIGATTASRRFEEDLLALFALVALMLAAAGLYSVLAHLVRGRSREIAVRSALGASAGDVLRMVLVEAAKPTLGGLAIGLAGTLLLAPVLKTMVFGVTTFDPTTLAGVMIVMLAVAVAAGVGPAYRAVRLDPVKVLREE
jgi:putative ABC transport system permease protein